MPLRLYVLNPEVAISANPDEVYFGFTLLEWEQGLPGIFHPPFNGDTLVVLNFNDRGNDLRRKIIDLLVANYPVTQVDIVFIPEIGVSA